MKAGDKVILKKFEENDDIAWCSWNKVLIGKEVEVEIVDNSDNTFQTFGGVWWLQSACEPVKNERYFLLTFISGSTTGNINLRDVDGKFPSNKKVTDLVKINKGFENAIIINVFEFKSEQDYLCFTQE